MSSYGESGESARESSEEELSSDSEIPQPIDPHRWIVGPWLSGEQRSYCQFCGALRFDRCDGAIGHDDQVKGRTVFRLTSRKYLAAVWRGGAETAGPPACIKPTRRKP